MSGPSEGIRRTLRRSARRPLKSLAGVLQPFLLEEPRIYGSRERVLVAPTAQVNNTLFNVVSGTITVGDYAFFGFDVLLLTGTHDYRLFGEERFRSSPFAGRDIVIGAGAWVSSGVTVIGPASIGGNAVVAAGALVVGDVAPFAVVAGIPARVVKHLAPTSPPSAGENAATSVRMDDIAPG